MKTSEPRAADHGLVETLVKTVRMYGLWPTLSVHVPASLRRRLGALLRGEGSFETDYAQREADDGFDRLHGTDTAGLVEAEELDVEDAEARTNAERYRAALVGVVRSGIEALPAPLEPFTFVDLGCGKGRVLLLASHYPFARVSGVEFSPDLVRVAESNLEIYDAPGRRCLDLGVQCADVREFELPLSDTVFFLYEPFGPKIAHPFFERVGASLRSSPRRIWAVWVGHFEPTFLRSHRWLSKVAEVDSPNRFWRIFLYANGAARGDA